MHTGNQFDTNWRLLFYRFQIKEEVVGVVECDAGPLDQSVVDDDVTRFLRGANGSSFGLALNCLMYWVVHISMFYGAGSTKGLGNAWIFTIVLVAHCLYGFTC